MSNPTHMALIPRDHFLMGDTLDGMRHSVPCHPVYVSAFYMDKYEVTKTLWDEVYNWAIKNNYTFEYGALGKTNSHPAHSITWYDAVKWCNARSEKEGKTPAYYTDAGLSNRYKTLEVEPYVKWDSGYRLPTEAEWEKAARGGVSGHRFPWSDTDDITQDRANYNSTTSYSYDTSPTRGHHTNFNDGVSPYTSPVGYFAPNGYGLYDMAGNVYEWCWDRWSSSYYSSSPSNDPRGPTAGSNRVARGGSWGSYAIYCRAARRSIYDPAGRFSGLGFRTVLLPGQ